MEVLAATVVFGLGAAAVIAATFGSLRASDTARTRSQLSSLATSFGESVKSLPYFVCAAPADYQSAFLHAESLSPAAVRLQGKLSATLTVVDVQDNAPGSTVCPSKDSGTQLVTLDVVSGELKQTVKIVKRTPDPNAPPASVDFGFDGPEMLPHYPGTLGGPRTGLNNPIVQFGMVPRVVSTPGVALYEWYCFNPDDAGDAWMQQMTSESGGFVTVSPGRAADYATSSATDADATCAHDKKDGSFKAIQAPVNSEGYTWIGLRVTERSGIVYPVFVRKVWLPPSTYSLPKPIAVITQLTLPGCTDADSCSTTADVQFNGWGSRAGDGRSLVKCAWTFDDGSDPEVFVGADCASATNILTHRFGEQRSYTVRLTVTDDVGQTSTASKTLVVKGPPRPQPVVKIKASVDGGATWGADRAPVYGIQSLRVNFSAAGSAAQGGATITGYLWTFGDDPNGATATGATTSHTYAFPSIGSMCDGVVGKFKVTLTVTEHHAADNWSSSATASQCVEVAALAPPKTFTFGWAELYFVWDWFNSETGVELWFQWTPVPPTSSDRANGLQVKLSSSLGVACTLNDQVFTVDRNVGPLPGGALWQGSHRISGLGTIISLGWNGIWQSVSHSCLYQTRTVRTDYLGNTTYSPWSTTQQFPGFFG